MRAFHCLASFTVRSLPLCLLVGCGATPTEGGPDNSTSSGGNTTSAGGSPATTGGSGTTTGGAGGTSSNAGSSSGAATNGGSTSAGTGNGGDGGTNTGGNGVTSKCESPVGPGLPENAPELTVGTWVDISPPDVDWGNGPFTQGMAVDPCNPAVLYVTSDAFDVSKGGLFKSIDAGTSWTRIGTVEGGGMIDEPIRVRVDPNDTQHLYVGDGVRGATMGFFVSTDGGATFTMPQGFKDVGDEHDLFQYDVYDVAVDPTDFSHVLVAFHAAWGWTDSQWDTSSGILESTDGGETWSVHAPGAWGTGHAINFLYNPELGLGDSNTWLVGTQGPGMHKTTDGGESWTQVSETGIQHGGGTVHYAQNGDLYATSGNTILKSTNNGDSFTPVGPGGGYNGIGGDGTNLYTMKCFGPSKMLTATEADGATWSDFNSQEFASGPFELVFDPTNKILYSAAWGSGMWALKVE
jgi:hypothetical protein